MVPEWPILNAVLMHGSEVIGTGEVVHMHKIAALASIAGHLQRLALCCAVQEDTHHAAVSVKGVFGIETARAVWIEIAQVHVIEWKACFQQAEVLFGFVFLEGIGTQAIYAFLLIGGDVLRGAIDGT
jgi:hypothetical protein